MTSWSSQPFGMELENAAQSLDVIEVFGSLLAELLSCASMACSCKFWMTCYTSDAELRTSLQTIAPAQHSATL